MIEQHHKAEQALLRQEPIILIEEEKKTETAPLSTPVELPIQAPREENNVIELPWKDWVSIDSSPQAELEEPEEQSMTREDEQEQPEENNEELVQKSPEKISEDIAPISQEAIADALSVAQQLLAPNTTIVPDTDGTVPMAPEIKIVPQQAKNKMTFAQLAQGFVKHVEQAAAIEVDSNKKGVASIEQLKHLHYINKIYDYVQNSWTINSVNRPTHVTITKVALIELVLNQDGSIHTLNLVQSSGDKDFDRFLLYVFKDASSSFPPVPALLKAPYRLPQLFAYDPTMSPETRSKRKFTIRY